jgi:hypothetical protein
MAEFQLEPSLDALIDDFILIDEEIDRAHDVRHKFAPRQGELTPEANSKLPTLYYGLINSLHAVKSMLT